MSKTRVGVVGVGYLGRLHTRVLTEMPEVEVVGIVEPDDEKAAEACDTLGLERFSSVGSIKGEIEGAVIATPTIYHADVALELLEAGCDVMIEKPITENPETARRIIETAKANGRLVQVGHVERYNPAVTAVVPIMDTPRYIEAQRIGVFSARSLDIDVLLDLMIHDIHLVHSLLKSEVVDIKAIGIDVLTDQIDMANVRLELANGAVANLVASRVAKDKMRKFRIFGRDVYLSIDTRDQEVRGYRLTREGGERRVEQLELTVEKKEPLRAELEAFVHCIRTRENPLVDGEEGLAALELALRIAEEIKRTSP